jgi:hypothetical protein
VRLINIQDSDSIAAVTKVDHEDEVETEVAAEGTTPEAPTGEVQNDTTNESTNDEPKS